MARAARGRGNGPLGRKQCLSTYVYIHNALIKFPWVAHAVHNSVYEAKAVFFALVEFFSSRFFFHLGNQTKGYILDVIVKNKSKRSSHACCSRGVVLERAAAAAAAVVVIAGVTWRRWRGGNELMAPVGRQTVSLSITMATLAVYSLKVRLLIKCNYSEGRRRGGEGDEVAGDGCCFASSSRAGGCRRRRRRRRRAEE